MKTVSVAEAKAHLSDLINQATDGETVTITRRGKPVAQLVPAARQIKKVDVEMLRKITEGMPMQPQSAGEFIRAMRDSDRY
jgi:prevent-host-death family protein